jgi:hypothetical protein
LSQGDVFVDLEALREFLRNFRRYYKGAERDLFDRMVSSAQMTAQRLSMQRLPSGGMSVANSILRLDVVRDPDLLVSEVVGAHPWMASIEYGTEPHNINVSNSEFLDIEEVVLPRGGKERPYGLRYSDAPEWMRKLKHVRHPGARAFNIFRDTKDYIVRQLDGLLKVMAGRMGFK